MTIGAAVIGAETATPRRRRWHRWAIPFGVVLAVLATTGILYAIEQPDPGDAEFLSPVSSAGIGARSLADRLAAAGVTVRRETRTSDALVAAHGGDATLFISTPALVHPYYLRMLRTMPPSTRVVLVEPTGRTMRAGGIPVDAVGRRWATAVVPPGTGCSLPTARSAGRAAVARQRYGPVDGFLADPEFRCYDGGLVGLRRNGVRITVIGSADPFRNDRAGEHANAALATALLGGAPRVVWLDLHRREPAPGILDRPDAVRGPPSLAPAPTNDPRFQNPDAPEPPPDDPPPRSGPNPLWKAFPAWFWAMLAQLALAAVAVALWRARRLGPPVTEPLPVTVRAAETVFGRGRLYRRAKDPGATLAMLRRSALRRLATRLEPPAGAGPDEIAALIAGHSGWPIDEVNDLLHGPDPDRDADLVRLARRLEALVRDASAAAPRPGDHTQTGGTR